MLLLLFRFRRGQKCISLFWLRENGEGWAVIVFALPIRRGSSIHEEGASFLSFSGNWRSVYLFCRVLGYAFLLNVLWAPALTHDDTLFSPSLASKGPLCWTNERIKKEASRSSYLLRRLLCLKMPPQCAGLQTLQAGWHTWANPMNLCIVIHNHTVASSVDQVWPATPWSYLVVPFFFTSSSTIHFGKQTFVRTIQHSSFLFNHQASLDNQTLSVRVLTAQASCLEGAVAARDLGKTASADDDVMNHLKTHVFPM